jgi:hypothetical protein
MTQVSPSVKPARCRPCAFVSPHGSYQVNKNVELFANLQNRSNQHYGRLVLQR